MTTLIVGASGATGKLLVEHLLDKKQKLKIIVRSPEKIPESWKNNYQLSIIKGSVSDIRLEEIKEYIKDCDSVASCLGHNMTFQGIFGKPRKLVTNTIALICNSIEKNNPDKPVKVILMNTSGNSNRDLCEPISFAQKIVIFLLRNLVPPHLDNEMAADYLRSKIGQNNKFIEWVAVRPDGLINETVVSEYETHQSPTRSAIFDSGSVSRTNVAHFMANLIINNELWNKWKGQMPVIYSKK